MSLQIQAPESGRCASDAKALKVNRRQTRRLKIFDPTLVRLAAWQSVKMLNPIVMMRNPVMFLVEVGTVLTAIVTVESIVNHLATGLIISQAALTALLPLTVLFATFAEALAEARGK